MKKLTPLFLVLLLFGCATPTSRHHLDDHLEPDLGILSGSAQNDLYHLKIRVVLRDGFAAGVLLRMVCVPSFEPEWMVFLREDNGNYSIHKLVAQKHLWGTELERMYADPKKIPKEIREEIPPDWREVGVDETSAPIKETTARILATLWAAMLEDARYPHLAPYSENRSFFKVGLDGENYHFSMFVKNHGAAAGCVWSPEPTTKTGRLVEIAHQLASLSSAPTEQRLKIEEGIRNKAISLLHE